MEGNERYKARYVLLAIALLAGTTIGTAFIDPTGKLPVIVGIAGGALLMAFIFGYQWWSFATYRKDKAATAGVAGDVDDAGTVTSADAMMAVLATRDLEPGELERRIQGSTVSMFRMSIGLGAAISLVGISFAALFQFGVIKPEWLGDGSWTPYAPIVLFPFAMLWVRFMMRRSQEASQDYLEPLGLELTEMPEVGAKPRWGGGMQTHMRGATLMGGERHGRSVSIELGGGLEVTSLSGRFPEFSVTSDGDRLVAKPGAPAAVRKLVEGLQPSQRWKKLEQVESGPEGMIVTRDGGTAHANWLWDLWLAERLAQAVKK